MKTKQELIQEYLSINSRVESLITMLDSERERMSAASAEILADKELCDILSSIGVACGGDKIVTIEGGVLFVDEHKPVPYLWELK